MKSYDNIETKIVSKAVANNVSDIKPNPLKTPALQTQLKICQPDDKYEHRADLMADKVMAMPQNDQTIQRACSGCEEEELQMKTYDQPYIQIQPVEEEEEMIHPKIRMQPIKEEEELLQTKSQTAT